MSQVILFPECFDSLPTYISLIDIHKNPPVVCIWYIIILKIPKGEKVEIISDTEDWYEIHYNEKYGYVSKLYVLTANSNDKSSVSGCVITKDGPLNVRDNPSINAKVIGSVDKGTEVLVVDDIDDWFKIEYGSSYGYVSKQFVKLD